MTSASRPGPMRPGRHAVCIRSAACMGELPDPLTPPPHVPPHFRFAPDRYHNTSKTIGVAIGCVLMRERDAVGEEAAVTQ